MYYKEYISPELRVFTFYTERGFASSLEDPNENPELDW